MSDKLDIEIRHGRGKAQNFEIYTVPNKFNKIYPEYMTKLAMTNSLVARFKDADTEESLNEIEKEMEDSNLEGVLEMKYDLVRSLMKANEYDFDLEFWDEKANPADVNTMITNCSLKDLTEADKKKLASLM